VLARAMVQMIEKEKLVPVRMQVINKPGGNGAVAAAALAEKKDDRTPSASSPACGSRARSPRARRRSRCTT
jgi:tripartite-type tricarboxylate transporter receptor subunit TctC